MTLHDRTTKSLLHLHKKKKPPSISAQFQVRGQGVKAVCLGRGLEHKGRGMEQLGAGPPSLWLLKLWPCTRLSDLCLDQPDPHCHCPREGTW